MRCLGYGAERWQFRPTRVNRATPVGISACSVNKIFSHGRFGARNGEFRTNPSESAKAPLVKASPTAGDPGFDLPTGHTAAATG
jgi:hypothetical protein